MTSLSSSLLQVWAEDDADGQVQQGELQSLQQHNISSLNVGDYNAATTENSSTVGDNWPPTELQCPTGPDRLWTTDLIQSQIYQWYREQGWKGLHFWPVWADSSAEFLEHQALWRELLARLQKVPCVQLSC